MILFRLEANSLIGRGHFARTSTLARWLQQHQQKVIFLTSKHTVDYLSSEEKKDLQFKILTRTDFNVDEELLIEYQLIFREYSAELLILDHYNITADFVHLMRQFVQVGLFDDEAKLKATFFDLVINQNMNSEELMYQGKEILLGGEYALINNRIKKLRPPNFKPKTNISQILISLGGGANWKYCEKILSLLNSTNYQMKCICPDLPENPSVFFSNSNIEFYSFTTEIPRLMRWADLSINAGGSTCLELACLGTPMLVFGLYPNQIIIGTNLAKGGYAEYLGDQNTGMKKLAAILLKRGFEKELLDKLNKNAEKAFLKVTGEGVEKVGQSVLTLLSSKEK